MAKAKATTIGEYIVEIAEDYKVKVYRIPKTAKDALRDCAEKAGLEAGANDTTQDYGRKLLKNFCNGEKSGTIGEYHIERRDDNHIDVYQEHKNTKGALREISELIGFEYDGKWDTQHFGRQLVKYAEENGPFDMKNAKKAAAASSSSEEASVESNNEDKLKGKKIVTVKVSGRGEVYHAAAVLDPDNFDKDEFDLEESDVSMLESEGITDPDTLMEFTLLYKNITVEVDGEEIETKSVEVGRWLEEEPAFAGEKTIVSQMVPVTFVEQEYKIAIDEDKEFDPSKLQLIDVNDEDAVVEFQPEGYIVTGEIIYDGVVIKSMDEAFPGGSYHFSGSQCIRVCQGGCGRGKDNFITDVEYCGNVAIMPDNVVEKPNTDCNIRTFKDRKSIFLSDPEAGETQLDLTNCPSLDYLEIADTIIKSLDVSKNTKLTNLICNGISDLTSIDLSNNPLLQELCFWNTGITELDLSGLHQLEKLSVVSEDIYKLDLSNNLHLKGLSLDAKHMYSIDLSNNTELERVHLDIPDMDELDLSQNTNLRSIEVTSNYLPNFTLPETAPVRTLEVKNAENLYSLDVSMYSDLEWFSLTKTGVDSIDLSKNTKLKRVTCNGNDIEELDLSACEEVDYVRVKDVKSFKLILPKSREGAISDLEVDDNVEVIYK